MQHIAHRKKVFVHNRLSIPLQTFFPRKLNIDPNPQNYDHLKNAYVKVGSFLY